MGAQAAVGHGARIDRGGERLARPVTLRLDRFAGEALARESARLGVSREELASFSVLYYLEDGDSERIARRPGLFAIRERGHEA